jgi:purine-binding chemotaxis protein CheW
MAELNRDNLQISEVEYDVEQFVSFLVNDELYAVDVKRVHEIIGIIEITPVPKTVKFMKGVINLRGTVVPVIDIRLKFEIDIREYDDSTVIIIVEVKNRLIGMIVDTVSDVLDIPSSEIQKTYHFSVKIEEDYIDSIAKIDDRLVIILNVDEILSKKSDTSAKLG